MSKSENITVFEAALMEGKDLRETYEAALKRIVENKEASSDGETLVKATAELGRAMTQAQDLRDEKLEQISGGTGAACWSNHHLTEE